MLESLGQYLIDNYMANLRKELVVSGLCGANLAQVLAESHTHLIEAMETANPQNGLEAERVIREFGSSKLLAKRLSKEYRRKSAQRFLVWPPVVVMITMILMRCGRIENGLREGKQSLALARFRSLFLRTVSLNLLLSAVIEPQSIMSCVGTLTPILVDPMRLALTASSNSYLTLIPGVITLKPPIRKDCCGLVCINEPISSCSLNYPSHGPNRIMRLMWNR